jgi:hypothetical protein
MRASAITIILVLAVTPAAAQLRTPGVFASTSLPRPGAGTFAAGDTLRTSTGLLVIGGVAGGALGFIGGAYAGYYVARADCEDDEWFCGLDGVAVGALIGEALMLPLGVHLMNSQRGPYVTQVLASGVITGAGLLAGYFTPDLAYVWAVAVPVAQLFTVIKMERAALRAR